MKIMRIRSSDLKNGDIFSFRIIKKPIWWRFIEIKNGTFIYEEIRSKFRHTTKDNNEFVEIKL
jgi:hypothetical protein